MSIELRTRTESNLLPSVYQLALTWGEFPLFPWSCRYFDDLTRKLNTHTNTFTYIYTHTHACTYIHIHTYTNTLTYLHAHTHIHQYTHIYVCTYSHILMHTNTHTTYTQCGVETSPQHSAKHLQHQLIGTLRQEDHWSFRVWGKPGQHNGTVPLKTI